MLVRAENGDIQVQHKMNCFLVQLVLNFVDECHLSDALMTIKEIQQKLKKNEFEIIIHAFEEAVNDNSMKTCSKCRSTMVAGTADLKFNRKGLQIRVKKVPAWLCTNCNHKTLNGKVAIYIDRIVRAIFSTEQPICVREVVLEAA